MGFQLIARNSLVLIIHIHKYERLYTESIQLENHLTALHTHAEETSLRMWPQRRWS